MCIYACACRVSWHCSTRSGPTHRVAARRSSSAARRWVGRQRRRYSVLRRHVGGFVFVFANVVFFSENQLLFPQKRQARQKDRQKRQGQTEKTDETDETDETITGETEGDRINETSPTKPHTFPFPSQKCPLFPSEMLRRNAFLASGHGVAPSSAKCLQKPTPLILRLKQVPDVGLLQAVAPWVLARHVQARPCCASALVVFNGCYKSAISTGHHTKKGFSPPPHPVLVGRHFVRISRPPVSHVCLGV
jgi:hypothetical protein